MSAERTRSEASVPRIGCSPRGVCNVHLTDEMIALRDGIAKGLGYVLRRCSLGGDFECWETEALTYEFQGRMASPFHCVRASQTKIKGEPVALYGWPGDAEKAAHAIDKSKPKKEARRGR
jgi:hypothetical protein